MAILGRAPGLDIAGFRETILDIPAINMIMAAETPKSSSTTP
jgi:hypothetical protein